MVHPQPSDLALKVRYILHQLTAIPPHDIEDEHELGADLGMDSVAQMEMLGMFSEELGIDVELEDAFDVQSVADVVALAQACLDRKEAR